MFKCLFLCLCKYLLTTALNIIKHGVGLLVLTCKPNLSTGERAPPAVSSSETQLQMEEKKTTEVHKASVGNEDDCVGQPESRAKITLSFSEDQNFSQTSLETNPNESGNEKSVIGSNHPEKEGEDQTEQRDSEMLLNENDEKTNNLLHSEDEIEPSTDEELRLWRYPQCKVHNEEDSAVAEASGSVCVEEVESPRVDLEQTSHVGDSGPSDIQAGEVNLDNASAEVAGSSGAQEDEKLKSEAETFESEHCLDQSQLNDNKVNMESCEGSHEGAATEDTDVLTTRQEEKNTEGCSQMDDVGPFSKAIQTEDVNEEYMDVESVPISPVNEMGAPLFSEATQRGSTGTEEDDDEDEVSVDLAQSVTDAQTSEQCLETEEMDQGATGVRNEEADKAEGKEASKKVTFILEPELIVESKSNSAETSGESCVSTWAA